MLKRIDLTVALVGCISLFAGCGGGTEEYRTGNEGDNVTNVDPVDAHGHHHDAGPHGGHILEFGAYHGEITLTDGIVSVYILGDDAKTAVPLEGATAKLNLKSGEQVQEIELTASPLEGEAEGSSSRFVSAAGALPEGIDDIEKIQGSVELKAGDQTMKAEVEHHHDHGHGH